jgi:hypothetical protein
MIETVFSGGVLVYISETLKVKRREDLEIENSEMIWVEIEFSNYKILLCMVYRSPGATNLFWQNFEYSIKEAFNYTSNVIITGDLNVDLFIENNTGNSLSNIINVFYLQNVIHEHTRIKKSAISLTSSTNVKRESSQLKCLIKLLNFSNFKVCILILPDRAYCSLVHFL